MDSYKYSPLLPAPKSIRLVQILPGDAGTDLHCYMLGYVMSDECIPGLYEALSYVWGDWTDSKKIYLADAAAYHQSPDKPFHSLDVTNNLYIAMQHLRDTALPRVLWIDAVCINQNDLVERAEQVNFMATIFSHAVRVVVWLGEEQADSTKLFAALEDLAVHAQHAPEELGPILADESVYRNSIITPLNALLVRPWFHRIWVLQEVAVARYVTVVCGQAQLTATLFATALSYLVNYDTHYNFRRGTTSAAVIRLLAQTNPVLKPRIPSFYDKQLSHFMSRQETTLGNLLDRFHRHEATDRRDKVFALLGMSKQRTIIPDYTQDWATVFRKVISQVLGLEAIVSTWNNLEQACITTSGFVLGVMSRDNHHERFHVQGLRVDVPGPFEMSWSADWPNKPYCKRVAGGDVLFLADGVTQPSIIRSQGGCFDVIVVSVPSPTRFLSGFRAKNISDTFDWRSLLASPLQSRNQVTMVWSWLSRSDDDYCEPEALLLADPAGSNVHPSYSMRVKGCAHIMEMAHYQYDPRALDQWLDTIHYENLDNEVRGALMVLHAACAHWRSYDWLKGLLESLRWHLWDLRYNKEGHSGLEMVSRYIASETESSWSKNSFSHYNIFGILDLVHVDSQHTEREHQIQSTHLGCDTHTLRTEDDTVFIQGLFSAHLTELSTSSIEDPTTIIGCRDSIARHVIRFLLARRKAEVVGIQITCQQLLWRLLRDEKSSTSPSSHSVPKPHIKMIETDYFPLALLSELRGGMLSISLATLTAVVWIPKAFEVFSFLLLISRNDFQTAYNVFAAVSGMLASRRRNNFSEEVMVSWEDSPFLIRPSWYVPSFSKWASDNKYSRRWLDTNPCRTIVDFLVSNSLVLQRYVETPGFLELAAATVDDNVIPFLVHAFNQVHGVEPVCSDLFTSRQMILDGIRARSVRVSGNRVS